MPRIDILAYKMNSFDTADFTRRVASYRENSIIVIFDFDKVVIKYNPKSINFKKSVFKFYKTKNERINKLFSPFLFLLAILLLIRIFAYLSIKYRPKVCLIENDYVAFIIGIFKMFGLCGKLIYLSSDWLVNTTNKKFLSYVANNLFFLGIDYFVCKMSDIVLCNNGKIAEARYNFWGRKIAKREKIYSYPLHLAVNNELINKKCRDICFIGAMREDSGLDIAIKCLARIRERQDNRLIIIGLKNKNYEYFKQLSIDCGVEPYVKFLGFVEAERFVEILSECFCGINILKSFTTYSSYTFPGKLFYYLQYLLPLIVTEGSGPFASVARDKNLGLVIEPAEDVFIDAVFKIYDEQKRYKENIIQYINTVQGTDIKELIEG